MEEQSTKQESVNRLSTKSALWRAVKWLSIIVAVIVFFIIAGTQVFDWSTKLSPDDLQISHKWEIFLFVWRWGLFSFVFMYWMRIPTFFSQAMTDEMRVSWKSMRWVMVAVIVFIECMAGPYGLQLLFK